MPEQLFVTAFLNRHFGAAVTSLLNGIHLHPAYPQAPITNAFAMELVVVGLLVLFFSVVRVVLSVESPGNLQQVVEVTDGILRHQCEEIIGHDYGRYVPYILALTYFILLSNLLGLVPGFESPTASPVVPLGLAATTFIYYHVHGIRHHRHRYVKQFLGPVWYLAPLMFVIEVISHFARILSLTVRLYANMFAGDLVTLAFLSLVPLLVPVAFLILHLGVAFIQTYIFVMLAIVYVGMATGEEH